MLASLLLDDRLGHVIQHYQAFIAVLHSCPSTPAAKPCRYQEYARRQFWHGNLPIPLKLAHLLLPASRVDLEHRHGLQMSGQFGE
ncbi:hypothetical protein D3C72_1713450 [compost metagenome]